MRGSQLLTLGLALLVLATASCDSGGDGIMRAGGDQGRVVFMLTGGGEITTSDTRHGEGDDALPMLQSASVTFSSFLARNLDGELIDVDIDLPVTIDVFDLLDRQIELPMGSLPTGFYDQLVVVITHVELVTLDGTRITITPPGGGWTVIVRVCEFMVDEATTTTVQIRFHAHRSFRHLSDGFHFAPQFECAIDSPS